MTCRQWQLYCRPLLFHHLTLRHLQDVWFLAGALGSPLSAWLANHVQVLKFVPEEPGFPIYEFQRAWRSLSRHLSGLSEIHFDSGLSTINSTFCPLLSRPCPRALLHVRDLDLRNVRFPSFSAPYRALSALRSLESLQLAQIQWSVPCTMDCPPSCATPFPDIKHLHVEGSSKFWPSAWMFALSSLRYSASWRSPQGNEAVSTEDVHAHMRVIAEMTQFAEQMRVSDYVSFSEVKGKTEGLSRITIFFGRRNSLVLGFTVSPPCSGRKQQYRSLSQVVVLIDDHWEAVNWVGVEAVLVHSPTAVPVDVIPGWHFRSHEEEELQARMPGRRATLQRVMSDIDKVKMVKEFWENA
ncbi:uncharacterized protein PHACADRAFT_31787 [Phanerochaete carnosa HHB-10118-sp]|uniref:Uncharacterized protein n=1 Tax=Phanerochaete carnosa (strain HHB-10118-sp) TaxID=650164 RepID=K5UQA1_PHACS|nr:uncharacterized protein PHACADRAFT_31787 [Phanerochaete carnosa HHB-10118-sp]EKM52001.1 hypothetical protein PHACADRAFT_31787 [Phanerochaete carnosa HHB-10118-sp]